MSKETTEWLNENTYVGKLADRAFHAKNNWMIMDTETGGVKPWWHQDTFEHGYDGFIPVEDVMDGLFNWEPVESIVRNMIPCTPDEADGVDGHGNPYRIVVDEKRKGIIHPTRDVCYGYFGKESYTVHSYSEWLIGKVIKMMDGGGLTSAGLLQDGGQAYVTIEAPEGFTVGGLDVRPMVVAGTSCNGTMVSKYITSAYAAICDNSFNEIMQSAAKALKIKHSSKSMGRFEGDAGAKALGLINQFAEELDGFLGSMMNADVTDSEFIRIIQGLVPDVDPKVEAGKVTNQRALTIMENKRGELLNLWKADPRVTKWNGTLFGAFQAANTWNQHFRSNNENSVERGMTGILNGQFAQGDREFWEVVKGVETISTKGLILVGAQ